jgi:hypothetical protein
MHATETRFEKALARRIEEERQIKLEQIGAGVDVDQYKYWTGYLRGLKDVVALMEEVRKKLDED